jgi:hypothetical protein
LPGSGHCPRILREECSGQIARSANSIKNGQ